MKPLSACDLKGSWATVVCSWNADGSLDLTRVANQIDVLISMNVSGIYSHGTAGEFHQQDRKEFLAIAELLAMRCEAAGMPFQIGVSHMSAVESLARLKDVVELAPGAVQVILPDWFPVSDSEAVRFLSYMEEVSGGIGLVLYAPPFAKRQLDVKTVAHLSKHVPSLIGLKTTSGDEAWFATVRKQLNHLSVFVPGHFLASGVARGASGSYSNVACLHPGAAQKWWAMTATDLSGALELEQRIQHFMTDQIEPFLAQGYANFVLDRFLVQVGGWVDVGARARWPYEEIPQNNVQRAQSVLQQVLPEFAKEI